jgi:uncharacterized protein
VIGAQPSRRRRLVHALKVGAIALLAWPGFAADPTYQSLPPAKAKAVRPHDPDHPPTVVHGAVSDLAAALQALQQCQAGIAEPCELVRLNDEHITRGAEIRARAPSEPHPLFLWRFERHGTVLYLAGSIHILKPTLYPLPAPFDGAFAQADVLVLEVDLSELSEPDIQRHTLARGLLPEDQTLEEVLPPDLRSALASALPAYGLTLNAVSRAKPALLMNQLVVARLMTLGYLPEAGLESHYLARRGERPVLALESLDAQLALLLDQPMATQIALLEDAVSSSGDVEPLLAGLLGAWLAGDDERFMELFLAQPGHGPELEAFHHAVLTERNHTMADGIARLLQSDAASGGPQRTFFVLVGAAHLVGPEGIVALMQARGLEARRVRSDHTL